MRVIVHVSVSVGEQRVMPLALEQGKGPNLEMDTLSEMTIVRKVTFTIIAEYWLKNPTNLHIDPKQSDIE